MTIYKHKPKRTYRSNTSVTLMVEAMKLWKMAKSMFPI